MALYNYGNSSKLPAQPTGTTEFEILKARHRFLRDSEEGPAASSWDEQLALKYYDSLYREFGVCDLKHYKTGNIALRWRTEEEVLSGIGETTCGNSRCEHHQGGTPAAVPARYKETETRVPPLTTLELPFAYVEHGENKSALVKVVLCPSCMRKLMWKRQKEKEGQKAKEREEEEEAREAREEVKSGQSPEGKDDLGLERQADLGANSNGTSKKRSKRRGEDRGVIEEGDISDGKRRRRKERSRTQPDSASREGRRKRHSRSRSPRSRPRDEHAMQSHGQRRG